LVVARERHNDGDTPKRFIVKHSRAFAQRRRRGRGRPVAFVPFGQLGELRQALFDVELAGRPRLLALFRG
jgi:hypothetical protein